MHVINIAPTIIIIIIACSRHHGKRQKPLDTMRG